MVEDEKEATHLSFINSNVHLLLRILYSTYIYIYIYTHLNAYAHIAFQVVVVCTYMSILSREGVHSIRQSDPKVLYGFRPQNWKRRRAMRRWCGEAMGKCDRRRPTWSDRQPFRQSASANNSFNRSLTKLRTEYTQFQYCFGVQCFICFIWLQVTCHIMFFVTCIQSVLSNHYLYKYSIETPCFHLTWYLLQIQPPLGLCLGRWNWFWPVPLIPWAPMAWPRTATCGWSRPKRCAAVGASTAKMGMMITANCCLVIPERLLQAYYCKSCITYNLWLNDYFRSIIVDDGCCYHWLLFLWCSVDEDEDNRDVAGDVAWLHSTEAEKTGFIKTCQAIIKVTIKARARVFSSWWRW